jgi:hypothetical protein
MRLRHVEGLPTSLADELWYVRREPSLNLHGATAPGSSVSASYGGADPRDLRKDDLHRYLQLVDQALQPALSGRKEPLVVAAVEHVSAQFAEITSYAHLVGNVAGSPPDHMTDELHASTFALASASVEPETAVRERLSALAATGLVETNPVPIFDALSAGRVEQIVARCALRVNTTAVYEPEREPVDHVVAAAVAADLPVYVFHDADPATGSNSVEGPEVAAILRY